MKVWDLRKGTLAYTMFGHNGAVNAVSFSPQGDFFATGGGDCQLLIWKSSFAKPRGETIKERGLCESGHRTDPRTHAKIEECMKKTTKITPTVYSYFE